jgi:hypothetical protein
LPPDHFAVFKAVTKYAHVERDAACKALGIGHRRLRSWRGPLCTPQQFRGLIRGAKLIAVNRLGMGIPQGSPISALLSNIFMIDLDETMQRLANAAGASYRRYSDDILLVAPPTASSQLEKSLMGEVAKLGLAISQPKTKTSRFRRAPNGAITVDQPIQYLGFTFDGKRILLRSQTIARYVRRMKDNVKAARRAAMRAAKCGGVRRLRRQKLYARFSHLGPTSKMLAGPDAHTSGNNFWTYTKRASKIMKDDAIRRQLRKHWRRLKKEIDLADIS